MAPFQGSWLFVPQHKTQLTVAELLQPDGRLGTYIIYNQGDSLHICEYARTDQARPAGAWGYRYRV